MNFKYIKLLRKYRKRSHPKVFDWNWELKGYNRIALINYLISVSGGQNCNYLEIGCASNDLFDSVFTSKKTGVDPESGGNLRMTSDDFFHNNKDKKYNVIFIDGLHEYPQVRKDTLNALEVLDENGWIAFHDFLPSSWKEQNIPRVQRTWTGDCWKMAVELNQSEGIDFKIVNIDYGVGLIRKSKSEYSVPDLRTQLSSAHFDKFVEELPNLPVIEFIDAIKHIDSVIKTSKKT